MTDHHSIVQEVINSKVIIKQMGAPAAPLGSKIDAIIAEMQKALQFGAALKKSQGLLAGLKKAADDQSKKVDTAKSANDAIFAKDAEDSKYIQQKAKTLQDYGAIKDSKNKAIADAISRIQIMAMGVEKKKIEFFDSALYQTDAEAFGKQRKIIPAPKSGDGLPAVDLKLFTDRVDGLVKRLQAAVATAKTADQANHDLFTKQKAFDDMAAKVKPIEDALGKQLTQITADLNAAKGINADLDHTGSKEAFQRAAAVFKVLNDAIADYGTDAKSWAAKP